MKRARITLDGWFESPSNDFTASNVCRFPIELRELRALEDLRDPDSVLSELRAVDWSFSEADTTYLSHDLHPYPAKFIPQLPRTLISKLSVRGELIYDPFGGSGTTALEAVLLGRRALSTDIHPIAKIIGEAKTVTLTREEDRTVLELAEQLWILASTEGLAIELQKNHLRLREMVPAIPNIYNWFHATALAELSYLRWRISKIENANVRSLAMAAFSKSILKASFQDEETRYAIRPRQVESGSVIRLFVGNLQAGREKLKGLGPLLRFRKADFRILDLRNAFAGTPGAPPNESVDLIVTSPPYPNCTDYHLYHRFRLFWLGYDPRDLADKEIGSHLRHQRDSSGFAAYLSEMRSCLSNLHRMLRSGRYAVLVLGDGVFESKSYRTAELVGDAAKEVGFEKIGIVDRQVHATKRSFISPARRLRAEQLLILRKPDSRTTIVCHAPPYKLWPYEEHLRQLELGAIIGANGSVDHRCCIMSSALLLDRLRRLTFTHEIAGAGIGLERTWQSVIENGDASPSRRKDPKYATHGIHPYKGKFYPQLAKSLFNLAGLEPGQTLMDPFCGSGTVLLEGYLNGFRSYGTDLNILAVKIARVKTEILEVDPYLRDQLLAAFMERLRSSEYQASSAEFPSEMQTEIDSWFPPAVVTKLAWVFRAIEEVPHPRVREALEVLVSSIVRQVSQQEPKDLRIRRRADPLHDAPALELLYGRVEELRTRLQHFAQRSSFAPVTFIPATAIEGDSRLFGTFEAAGIQGGCIDAVVTSPPYATALPYIDTDRLSILLLFAMKSGDRAQLERSLIGTREIQPRVRSSLDRLIDAGVYEDIPSKTAQAIIKEVRNRNQNSDGGFRKQNMPALLYMYFRDMSKVIANISHLLRKGGSAFLVVGDTRTVAGGKEIQITTAKVLRELSNQVGLKLADSIPITVTTENRFHAKNSITENEIIWLKK